MSTNASDSSPNFLASLQKEDKNASLKKGRQILTEFNQQQFDKFDQGASVDSLIKERTSYVDQLIKKIWKHHLPQKARNCLTLIAVGGYGRGELQPYSDIDLLILGDHCNQYQEQISEFITYLWDLGFEVGHAVRTFEETIEAAKEDVSTATNLLEARWLTGDYENFERLQQLWNLKDFWPSVQFFEAKLEEQQKRHHRYLDIHYQLEPNIKESPGGLRDIHTVIWIAKRHYGANSLQELMQHNFITSKEFKEIQAASMYLNKVRFSLHRMKKRHEDRLLFDHQQQLAANQGYDETDLTKAVESFMKPYYQNVRIVAKLNEILIQHFKEEIFKVQIDEIEHINPRFRIVNDYLDVVSENLFEKNPTALLEIFIILENYKQIIKGIRSRTIRLIRSHLHLIDEQFRSDPINKALFIEIFRQPKGVNASLQRMYSYGILGAYLPCFQKITGLMQFNIFHAYTVDEHTILVIRNLRRFFVKEFAFEFPTAHQVAKQICKPEILLLSGLFHDIAKGRDGEHEILGAVDAKDFSFKHNLSQKDSELLSWLVLHHLDFSYVAQKKDISDPEVIEPFAKKIGTQEKLDYLYLLTLADVLSTSPDVWNDWKNQLFVQLYNRTSQALDKSSNAPKDRVKQAIQNKERARELLHKRSIDTQAYQQFWSTFDKTDFFNRQSPQEIARITQTLTEETDETDIHVSVEGKTQRGATELLIYMPDKDYLFTHITHAIDKLMLSIVEAKIYTSKNHKTLVILYMLNRDNEAIEDNDLLSVIVDSLKLELSLDDISSPKTVKKPEPRRIRVFETPTEIAFHKVSEDLTELTIHTKDIPGLLAKIGLAFRTCEVRLHDAKINTVGEKAEDVFLISSTKNESIHSHHCKMQLTNALLDNIE